MFQSITIINETEFPEQDDEQVVFENWRNYYPITARVVFALDISCATLSSLGFFGNIFTMVIISKWENISSGAAFMFALAFSDLFAGFYNGIIAMTRPLFGWTLSAYNDVICSICMYWSFTSTLYAYYATIFFSLDKCIAVLLPFKYREYGKPKVAIIATIVYYVILGLWTVPTVLVFRIHPGSGFCRAVNFELISAEFFFGTRNVIGWFVSGLIPIASVFLFTSITIGKIQQMKRKRLTSTTQSSRRDREMTRQMIIVCSLFTTFGVIFTIFVRYLLNMDTVKSYKDEVIIHFFLSMVRICQAVQNSANFYVYLIFGSKFRANFIDLIMGRKPASKKISRSNGLQAPKVSTKPVEIDNSVQN